MFIKNLEKFKKLPEDYIARALDFGVKTIEKKDGIKIDPSQIRGNTTEETNNEVIRFV